MAMVHPSYQNEQGLKENNQRFEFLGDAVIDLIVSRYLFTHLPQREGEMSRLRAAIVCEASLSKMAKKLGLHKELLLGKGEELSQGRQRPSLLSDSFEAFIGALFMDLGLEEADRFFLHHFVEDMKEIQRGGGYIDYKSSLQIQCQKQQRLINYEVLGVSGPDHSRLYSIGLYIDGVLAATGEGTSKREAQQRAAREVLGEDSQ
ncbi:MAG: ribonuclease III [Tissierellia bacterium]|nr:ribonuclease III [Tissierellia bacterium]